MNETLVFDTEANGLLHDVTKVWCVVLINAVTEVLETYHDFPELCGSEIVDPYDGKSYTIPKRNGRLIQGIQRLHKAGNNGAKLVAHNVLGYDDALMRKFYPKYNVPLECYHDTLIQSKVQWFERKQPKGAKGTHGLQAWGVRSGVNKPDIQDWSYMDAFKLHRCIEDVKINLWTYNKLQDEAQLVKERCGFSFEEAMLLEHKYRYYKTEQELRGAYVDVPHMEACIKDLDKKCEILREEIEPLLPPNCKAKAPKVGRNELMTSLGHPNPQQDKIVHIMKDGETFRRVIKDYYKPSVKFHKTLKGKRYKAVLESKDGKEEFLRSSTLFDKLKEARAWAKEQDVAEFGKKVKWRYPAEEYSDKILNQHTCDWFEVDETSTDIIVGAHTRVEFLESKLSQPAIVKKYLVSLGWEPDEWNLKKDSDGQFTRADKDMTFFWPEKAPRENQVSVDIKKNEPIPSSPKLTEKSYESLPEGVGRKIANYNTYAHRRTFIANPTDYSKGLLRQVRKDGRIPCGVNCFGTATGRASHYNWVNAAGIGALYGEEIRKIIISPKGRKLVGADMKSAQLSIAAYYANNYAYYDAIVNGEEVIKDENGVEVYVGESGHCVNARAFGLVSDEEWKEAVETQDKDLLHSIVIRRGKSKGCTFGTIFGCSGKKLAKMAGVSDREGAAMKKKFLGDIGLDKAIEIILGMMKDSKRGGGGYIELPMGYRAWCKMEHKAFNYIDQGTEAVMQKVAVVWFEEQLAKKGLDAYTVLDYHDEVLIEASDEDAEEVGQLMCDAYKYASDQCLEWHKNNSDYFNHVSFPFNLDGGFKVGTSYLEVH